ncbi:Hypothetical_protein [Hexamita inflata]|uniref:Hypothetical_protein n=1 Tax=Hexamita inflata TaxID=28002 RepID=A0ABP1KGU7_9EUKA
MYVLESIQTKTNSTFSRFKDFLVKNDLVQFTEQEQNVQDIIQNFIYQMLEQLQNQIFIKTVGFGDNATKTVGIPIFSSVYKLQTVYRSPHFITERARKYRTNTIYTKQALIVCYRNVYLKIIQKIRNQVSSRFLILNLMLYMLIF